MNNNNNNNNLPVENDCLFYKVRDDIIDYTDDHLLTYPHQIISYCLRLTMIDNELIGQSSISSKKLTFEQLRTKNITSNQLLSWSAPIDLVERYEDYLNNPYSKGSNQIFNNCTSFSFGEFCQYTFGSYHSFDAIVKGTFQNKISIVDNDFSAIDNSQTCFTHLNCSRSPSPICLDWREVCDGNVDCADGIDEKDCFELNLKKCAHNEYRCHIGLCVPAEFVDDNWLNSDCLDGTDENSALNPDHYTSECSQDPAFRCEERGKPQGQGFACGDGQFSIASIVGTNVGHICKNGRDEIVNRAISTLDYNKPLNYLCWLSTICNHPLRRYARLDCEQWDGSFTYYEPSYYDLGCSQDFLFPNYPVFLGHIRYAFEGDSSHRNFLPSYLCYDQQFCQLFKAHNIIQGWSCIRITGDHAWAYIERTAHSIVRNCLPLSFDQNRTFCDIANTFQCTNSSKCIFKHQLVDGIRDCPFGDDEETAESCMLNDKYRFRCISENKCLSRWLLLDGEKDCVNGEDENVDAESVLGELFSNTCNKIEEITLPVLVDGQNETDETNCEQWPCNNQYTRCNGFWDCSNGIDEIGCAHSLCDDGHHPCISVITNEFTCLPQSKISDNVTDCLGSYDERAYCRTLEPKRPDRRYRCQNSPSCAPVHPLCVSQKNGCSQDDKTLLCKNLFVKNDKCFGNWSFLCDNEDRGARPENVYFQLENDKTIFEKPNSQLSNNIDIVKNDLKDVSDRSVKNISYREAWLCNRGIVVRTSVTRKELCLCPPSYYGRWCEKQNERVSVTLKFRKENGPNSWRQVFYIVIMLIDNTDQIHSHDYFIFGSADQCIFNVYLLYLTRPKDMNKIYNIRIDARLINHFTIHASWLLPVSFLFLPVNRIAVSLIVPMEKTVVENDCKIPCIHGQCLKYTNFDKQYCRCLKNWFGDRCDIPLNCNCSPDSVCIGTVDNRSICICPIHKFGPRCLLSRIVCDANTCLHGGVCILDDERISSNVFRCLCAPGYSGSRCEIVDTVIQVQFSGTSIPSMLLLHYVTVLDDSDPITTTLFTKIFAYANEFILSTPLVFHILFVEFGDNYYLVVVQKHYKVSDKISGKITRYNRCRPIKELFNSTFLSWPILRRVKYYHLPCREKHNLPCLYDDQLMCLCNSYRQANCFEFKSNVFHECGGNGYCLNGARCFQDKPDCPSSLMCDCSECFYGSRCQLTTRGLSMSLDSILGYSIRPQASFIQQPFVIRMSAAVIIIIFIIGFINGILSTITFGSKTIRHIGCGWYLFALSITSLLIMTMLMIKFWLLLFSQMGIITRRSIVFGHCISIDFFVRVLLSTYYWLSTFVTLERVLMVTKGAKFNKNKSIRIAKWLIFILPFLMIGSSIQEILYRSLIDDSVESRVWCVAIYPHRTIELINWYLHICQIVLPFSINFIATIIIIIMIARQHTLSRLDQTYKEHLYEQLIKQKHLLLTPCILAFLNIPRLVLFFISTCMRTVRDPWFFLFSYLLAFIPSMLTFVIFVLPSKIYHGQFRQSSERIFSIRFSSKSHSPSQKTSNHLHHNE